MKISKAVLAVLLFTVGFFTYVNHYESKVIKDQAATIKMMDAKLKFVPQGTGHWEIITTPTIEEQ